GVSWLEFTTSTGDVVRLDPEHPIELRAFYTDSKDDSHTHNDADEQIRPYMMVRNGLEALIGRNTFYHLTDIGTLSEQAGTTVLTLQSGGQEYQLSMP
ncbi:MAG TPA: DUF1285 domain-containing protein, partial [Psychrobacter sp.]|nr:DUF1285 domain-containing protein [Psychrobacter sp.]